MAEERLASLSTGGRPFRGRPFSGVFLSHSRRISVHNITEISRAFQVGVEQEAGLWRSCDVGGRYVYCSAFLSWNVCMLYFNMLIRTWWGFYSGGLSGETDFPLRSLRSHTQPLRIMSGDHLEFSARLQAAMNMHTNKSKESKVWK